MPFLRYIFILFFIFQCIPLTFANSVNQSLAYEVDTPVERVKPKKKKQKIKKNSPWKQVALKKEKGLKNPALTFWLIFSIATILLIVAGAFIIGLGLAPWSLAAYVMLGAEMASFLTLMMILWVDRPGGLTGPVFFFALLGLIAVNVIVGLAFIIWGLAITWIFGWMLGLIMLGLAALFFLIHFVIASVKNKKDKKEKSKK